VSDDSRQASTLRLIETGRIIAILRGDFGAIDEPLAAALRDGGITALELTVDSPDAFARIERLARAAGDRMASGAGTVLTRDQVARAADAGASFIVSPNRNVDVIKAAVERGLVAIPGCLTPSEIVEALDAGAQAVKLFPAQILGPAFVRAVRAPLGDVRMVPTGGVTPEAIPAYREAGAWAFGIGSELVGRGAPASASVPASRGADIEKARGRARAFVGAAR
jgi:Entner-Doudoroff aldolase